VSVAGRIVGLLEQMFETDVRKPIGAGKPVPGKKGKEMSVVAPRHTTSVRSAVAPRSYVAARSNAVAPVATMAASNRRGRLIRAAVILALGITAVNQFPHLVPGASASNEKVNPGAIHWVSVRAGDSLWSLATRYAPNTDPREWIDQVTAINNLGTAGIYAGERIALPSN
jgi:hypothetical protein